MPMSDPAPLPDKAAPVRAVVRTLRLLRLMNQRPLWALMDLHSETGLPKSTLSRLLATLIAEGYVRAEEPAGTYRLTAKVRELDCGYTEYSRLVDVGRSIAVKVTKRIKWPLAIATLDQDAVVVRFSSMPYSPLAVHTTTLGHRLGLLESALGRVYLAFCGEVERKSILDVLMGPAGQGDDEARDWVLSDLARIRAEGYAIRQPGAARGSATLAVPILQGGSALASLSMTTFGRSLTPEAIAQHVPILTETARAMVEAFERQDDNPAP